MKPFFTLFLISTAICFIFSCEKSEPECQKSTFYKDADGDGLGNKAESIQDCEQPAGYVSNSSDTDDTPVTNPVSEIPSKGFTSPSTYPGMELIWADEFEGTSLDEKNWNYELGDGCPGNCGWGNNELQYYKKENTSVRDGYLFIEAKKESSGGKLYTSSRLTTQNKITQKFGRIDIRAVLPKGKGIWPALWMLGKNIDEVGWPRCGEIDIMEMIGGPQDDDTIYGTVHWDNAGSHAEYGGKVELLSTTFNDQFHVFSIIWDEKFITWYLDNKEYHKIDITPSGLNEFQKDFFFIFNVAVGGNWPGNPDATLVFPQKMIVDYVRVFR